MQFSRVFLLIYYTIGEIQIFKKMGDVTPTCFKVGNHIDKEGKKLHYYFVTFTIFAFTKNIPEQIFVLYHTTKYIQISKTHSRKKK